ncbi:MAG: glycerol-3-phosphate dehydrogenase/oxidase [Candidatus Hodarchaeales archaeon]|jgi:glycerol-3-phosphate dehydrogenase
MQRNETDLLDYRKETIEKLKVEEYDVLVVGGGITGAGIARDAAIRGYSVALIEKNDFGFGTSSGSSKIVHAGIRYIGQKEFRLVREGSVERKKMLEMAPHLTRPIKFLLPMYSDTKYPKSRIRKAVWLYDLFAGFKNYTFHKMLTPEKARSLLPSPLREENFQGAALWGDGQMDDVRLALDVLLSAEECGAVVLNYCKAISFREKNGEGIIEEVQALDKLKSKQFEIKARSVALACGHWTERVVKSIDPANAPRIRPTKGIHIITKQFYNKDYALGLPIMDGRIFFILPFGKYNLIGTTDTDYDEDYNHVSVNTEDIKYLIEATNFLFPGVLKIEDIYSAYSGVRPLLISPSAKSESDVSRNHEIFVIKPNLLAIAGGKYTTYRAMSKDLVDHLEKVLGRKGKCRTDKIPLHGWFSTKRKDWNNWATIAMENLIIRYKLPKDVAEHLLRYGKNYPKICEQVELNPLLRERISENRPYILAEIDNYIKYEKAVTLNDIMFRRTQLQLSEGQGLDCVERVTNHMAEILGWSSDKINEEIAKYKESLAWKP